MNGIKKNQMNRETMFTSHLQSVAKLMTHWTVCDEISNIPISGETSPLPLHNVSGQTRTDHCAGRVINIDQGAGVNLAKGIFLSSSAKFIKKIPKFCKVFHEFCNRL